MEAVKQLREIHPDLVDEYSAMSKEQLLEQICAEVLDLLAMEERVQVFMNECTENMSKTNYTPEVIKGLIQAKQEIDLNQFCADLFEENETVNDIIQEIKDRAEQL